MEYCVFTINRDGEYFNNNGEWRFLSELGQVGWELVAIAFESGDTARGFFKRVVPSHFVKTVAVLQGEAIKAGRSSV